MGYEHSIATSGNYEQDFLIPPPFDSGRAGFNAVPAYGSVPGKRWLFFLLRAAKHHEVLGSRPHNLEVTAISAPMADVAQGNAHFPQIARRRNFRAVAAHDMANIYSRKVAHRLLFVSKFALSYFYEDKGPMGLEKGPPVFLDSEGDSDEVISASNGRGRIASYRSDKHLSLRGKNDLRTRGKEALRGPFIYEIVIPGPPAPTAKRGGGTMNYV